MDVAGFKYGARGRTRTGTGLPPRDFKSLASTNFATRAAGLLAILPNDGAKREVIARRKQKTPARGRGFQIGAGNEIRTRDPNLGKVVLYQLSYSRFFSNNHFLYGGWERNRTAVHGFAGRCQPSKSWG